MSRADDNRVQILISFVVFFSMLCRDSAAESIMKDHCIPVADGESWAKYMSLSGSYNDEYDIITLQYTEEGLLGVDENREGRAAAFGDDIAIQCLASEYEREIFVVGYFHLWFIVCCVLWFTLNNVLNSSDFPEFTSSPSSCLWSSPWFKMLVHWTCIATFLSFMWS